MFWSARKDSNHRSRRLGAGGHLLIAALAFTAGPAAANDGGVKLLADAASAGADCQARAHLVQRLGVVFDLRPAKSVAIENGGTFEVFKDGDGPGRSCAIVVSSDRGRACLISIGQSQCSALNIGSDQ